MSELVDEALEEEDGLDYAGSGGSRGEADKDLSFYSDDLPSRDHIYRIIQAVARFDKAEVKKYERTAPERRRE